MKIWKVFTICVLLCQRAPSLHEIHKSSSKVAVLKNASGSLVVEVSTWSLAGQMSDQMFACVFACVCMCLLHICDLSWDLHSLTKTVSFEAAIHFEDQTALTSP